MLYRYHLGEHKMPMGKGEPYDTDTTLPMYLRGPGEWAPSVASAYSTVL
jgi:hypothetical protein